MLAYDLGSNLTFADFITAPSARRNGPIFEPNQAVRRDELERNFSEMRVLPRDFFMRRSPPHIDVLHVGV